MFGVGELDDIGDVVSREDVAAEEDYAAVDMADAADQPEEEQPKSKRARTEQQSGSRTRGRSLSSEHSPSLPAAASPPFRSSTALHLLQAARRATAGGASSPSMRGSRGSPALHSTAAAAAASSAHFSLPAAAASPSAAGRPGHSGSKPFRAPARSKLELERQVLPVFAARDEILETVRSNDTTILVGETGSGKTTQIPQYLLADGGLVGRGQVGCTQPRRVAAVSVATRVAQEYGCSLGAQVAYTIRFDDTSGPLTRLKYLTDGMLLREIIADPYLSRYNALVLDEAHERTVSTDILFALLKQIQKRRKRILALRKEAAQHQRQGHGSGKSPKQQPSTGKSPKLSAAAATPSKSPRTSPAAAAASPVAAQAAAAGGDDSLTSPGLQPLCLLSDQTHPQPRPSSKEARKERKKRKREEAEAREAALSAAAAVSKTTGGAPLLLPPASATSMPPPVSPSFALDDDTAPIDLASVPNLDALQELKLVVMSATLAAKDFSSYFGGAPVISIPGRTHPVELLYAEEAQVDYLDAALVAVMQIHLDAGEAPGDCLVFLTGSEEIEAARRSLEEKSRKIRPEPGQNILDLHVCAIYASLPSEVQMQVFTPAAPGSRKVILATNIAETSLTIPGVRFVVDSGVTKMRLYDAQRGSDMLRVVEISQAEATQRAGRAGRDAPGEAYRLYTEQSYQALKPHLLPEILRSNLASVVLQLKALRVKNVLSFDFMTRPSRAALTRALEELYTLRALSYNGDLSALGAQMVHFPLPPAYAKIAILSASEEFACSIEALKILAMMSVENVFFVPSKSAAESTGTGGGSGKSSSTTAAVSSEGSKQSALAAYAQAKRQFAHVDGDHFTYLDVYNAFVLVQSGGGTAGSATGSGAPGQRGANTASTSATRRAQEWCRAHFLNYRNLLKAQQVYAQLQALMVRLGLPLLSANAAATGRETDPVAHTEPIKKALLLGLFSRVARKQPHDASYATLSDGQAVYIHPSSVLLVRSTKARPELVVYTELVHTSRAYMRDCMELPDLRWLAELMPDSDLPGTNSSNAASTLLVKGGRQQAELHARLAGINANGSKLSGHVGGSSGAVAAGVRAAAAGGATLTLAQQAAALGLTKQQLKKQRRKAAEAAPPERAAPHASAVKVDAEARPPREKKKKKPGQGSALLDFVNSL